MGKWEEKKLREVYDVRDGTHDSPKYVPEGYPLVTSKNLKNNKIDLSNVKYITEEDYDSINKRSNVAIGDVLFAMIGTIGNPVLIEKEPNYAIKNVALFKKKDLEQDPKFLTYYLGSEKTLDKMISEAKGATQKFVGLTYLRNFPIPLPPLPEQQRIVTKLDGLFAKIDQAIGLLEENILHTQALMGSVLDEEFGKLKEFNQSIKSFCVNPKKDMVGGPFGSNLKASEYVESGFPIIRLQNVGRFNFKEKNIMFVTEEKAEFLSSHSYVSGDIVMTKLGDPLGKCCIIEDVHGVNRGVISSDIIRIRIDETKHYKPYVVAGINSEYFIKQLKSKTQGSTRPRVTLKEVREMQLPMLKREDQVIAAKRIDGILELQSKVIETQTQKLNHLKALKSSLLDQAFKGEL